MDKANAHLGVAISATHISEMEKHFAKILELLNIDWQEDQNTKETPHRFVKMLLEATKGKRDPKPKLTTFSTKSDQLILVGPITIKSMCSHHFLPVIGNAYIGIIPNGLLLGLSKFSRLADWVFRRPQIQEDATEALANELEALLQPQGLAVVVDCAHMCQQWRGVEDECSRMKTSVMRGAFLELESARAEFLRMISIGGRI